MGGGRAGPHPADSDPPPPPPKPPPPPPSPRRRGGGGAGPARGPARGGRRRGEEEEEEDLSDLVLAHLYRLSLREAPPQSGFRVVALVFYELDGDEDRGGGGGGADRPPPPAPDRPRRYVVGTNDEPCHISGSICAERAALLQLRFLPALRRVTKVVIVTDSADAIAPGMLCREFMASHRSVDLDAPIVLGGAVCVRCGLDVTPQARDAEGGAAAAALDADGACSAAGSSRFPAGPGGGGGRRYHHPPPASAALSVSPVGRRPPASGSRHDFLRRTATVRELHPHPSPYSRLTASRSAALGERHAVGVARRLLPSRDRRGGDRPLGTSSPPTAADAVAIWEAHALSEARRIARAGRGRRGSGRGGGGGAADGPRDGGPYADGGADGRDDDSGDSGLDGSAHRGMGPGPPPDGGPASSATSSAMPRVLERAESEADDNEEGGGVGDGSDGDCPGAAAPIVGPDEVFFRYGPESGGGGGDGDVRPIPRMRAAMHLLHLAAAACRGDDRDSLHPIRYGAAVLFSDGTYATACQKKALEYGCTYEAVGQLVPAIEGRVRRSWEEEGRRRSSSGGGGGGPVRPVLLVQCDRYGIPHAPFAQARAYLSEHGHGDCDVAVHSDGPGGRYALGAGGTTTGGGGDGADREEDHALGLLLVKARDLAPDAPDMFGGGC